MAHTGRGRAVRVPDYLWADAHSVAESHGETIAQAIREFLVQYVARDKPFVKPGVGLMRARTGEARRSVHTFYVSDDLWADAHETAERAGETISSAILTFLIKYSGMDKPPKEGP